MRGFTAISGLMTDFGLPVTRSWGSFFWRNGWGSFEPHAAKLYIIHSKGYNVKGRVQKLVLSTPSSAAIVAFIHLKSRNLTPATWQNRP
jgi:hypothetical protein